MVSVLGIDPGSRCTGYGIILDGLKGPVLVTYGTIRTEGDDLPGRLKQIYDGIFAVSKEFQPTELAIEQVFMSKNADSALKLGQARGAAICGGMSAVALFMNTRRDKSSKPWWAKGVPNSLRFSIWSGSCLGSKRLCPLMQAMP